MGEYKIPIKVIKEKKEYKREIKKVPKNKIFKTLVPLFLSLLLFSNVFLLAAYEAHIINVTARICNYSETRTMGFWKNHPNVYFPLLPQHLGAPGGDEIIDTIEKVNEVFAEYNLTMRNKLKGQLLAMKFNIAYFGIGGYAVESENKTLDEIVAEADNLLRDPDTPDPVLEEMKDLLDYLNNLHQIRYCSINPPIQDTSSLVVINEFLPNPAGADKDLMPEGEWVELYNRSDFDIDVNEWYLYDDLDSHPLRISAVNSDNDEDVGDEGETIVPSHGWLVVYLNGAYNGWLNNGGGDAVRLYDGPVDSGQLIDSYSYVGNAPENKSFARIPDGSDNWFDPIPTPGRPNVLEIEQVEVVEKGPVIEEEIISEEEEVIILPEEEIFLASEATTTEETATTTEEVATTEEIPTVEESAAEESPIQEELVIENEEPAVVEEESSAVEEIPITEEPQAEEMPPPAPEEPAPSPEEII
ncbi:lamin tail domain-containing protein [Patescibacteria group bacterium]|nr:lamin tail domain-containing protein [Patescibacteria group bacterium]